MEYLKNKIDFAAIVYVEGANPNGDPLDGNRPRTTIDGLGEISDVCIKRKLRNRLQDMGQKIFVQSADRADDGMKNLKARADELLKKYKNDSDGFREAACAMWYDVRAFGQLLAFKGKKENSDGISIGIRGPVTIRPALSVKPVTILSTQITKSVNSDDPSKGDSESEDGKSSDTMGMKYRVDHGVYVIRGSINPQLASKTGFNNTDADALKEALRTLFVNDCSSARPDGSMDVVKLVWWRHNCQIGQYSTAKVHESIKVIAKCDNPAGMQDYDVIIDTLDGLEPEII